MSNSSNPVRTCLLPKAWPTPDLLAWRAATAPRRGPFRRDDGGKSRNRYSVRKVASGYGRWIGFLQREGELDPYELPSQRARWSDWTPTSRTIRPAKISP
jgi:hypothetical protein